MENVRKQIVASLHKLAQMDPQDAAVDATVDQLKEQISQLTSESAGAEKPAGESHSWGDDSKKDDVSFLKDQIGKLQSAAEKPAKNYLRITSILAGLRRAAIIAERPQYVAMRPQIASIVSKVAGVFAEVDTTEDLDKPLEQIEKAVHGLYGDQSSNATYYFDRRGKGHHSDGDASK